VLPHGTIDKLKAMRRAGESYSDVIHEAGERPDLGGGAAYALAGSGPMDDAQDLRSKRNQLDWYPKRGCEFDARNDGQV
jgi:hypothetical protein